MQEERTLPVHLALLFIVLLFTGVILYAKHVTDSRAENPVISSSPTKLSTYVYGVNLEYPPGWQATPGYNYDHYSGPDGFFVLTGVGDADTLIDTIVRDDVSAGGNPYGISATITSITVDGEPARLILPSIDQPASMKHQAELIVKFPSPRTIDHGIYYYLAITADSSHIKDLTASLTFIR
jgi:hypothetical protein